MNIPSPHKIFTDRKRKKIITEVAALRLKGFSYEEIRKRLNRKKLYTMMDKKWTKHTIAIFIKRHILTKEG